MRKWIDLFENHALTVYHGSSGFKGNIKLPLFVTEDADMARSYAMERGREGSGQLIQFTFIPKKLAGEEDAVEVAEALGVYDGDHLSYYLDPNQSNCASKVIGGLRSLGYDSVRFSDFDFRSDFGETPAFAILDASCLSDMQVVEAHIALTEEAGVEDRLTRILDREQRRLQREIERGDFEGDSPPSSEGIKLPSYKGRRFWSGSIDPLDMHIQEIHTYETALGADWNHSFYFSENEVHRINDGESYFFWFRDGELHMHWRQRPEPDLERRMKQAILAICD
jgi:hypothetical protein